jgi:hypothetical protein
VSEKGGRSRTLTQTDSVRIRLDDGAVVEVARSAAEELYDLMWLLAPAQGAVTTAAKLHQALRQALLAWQPIVLDAAETRVFAQACERLAL